jgi:hypothetical protein
LESGWENKQSALSSQPKPFTAKGAKDAKEKNFTTEDAEKPEKK